MTGLAERQWENTELRVGAAVIRIHNLRQRCVMTTFDSVQRGAVVALGDPVELLTATVRVS